LSVNAVSPIRARVLLRPPRASDQDEFLAAVRASRGLHRPWVKPPATDAQFRDYLKRMRRAENRAFFVLRRGDPRLVGVVNLTQIVHGLFRSAYLGYYVFAGFERQGLMRAGLRAAVCRAFDKLRLHRLEANIQPGNFASIALVRSCGFSREGYSPKYLKIGGRWRDHERWAVIAR